jgi:hypothetical protein
MLINLFGHEPMDYRVVQQILAMKQQFLADGGTDENFPAFLAEQGVSAAGQFIAIDDSFVTLANLKQAPAN